MTRAFIVELEVADTSDIENTTADIQDSLLDDGFPVVSVKPYRDPTPDGGFAVKPTAPPDLPIF